MNKILIHPHYCSREEYQDLVSYLNTNCWDYSEIKSLPSNIEELKANLGKVIDLAEDIINAMPQKEDKFSDCQKILLRKIQDFSYAVKGIKESDLTIDG